jgi:lipoprotein-releasing system permease protein
MDLEFRIARRYLFSKKSTNAINIISGVSATAIGVGTLALILVLSVFNGLESLVKSLYTVFYPEIAISADASKTFEINDKLISTIKNEKNIQYYSFTLEENALLEYGDQQHIATLKGIDPNYYKVVSGFDSFMVKGGNKSVKRGEFNFIILGAGVAQKLNINTEQAISPVGIYMPKRTASSFASAENAFQKSYLLAGGMFAISDEFDAQYALVPLDLFQQLTENEQHASKVEIRLHDLTQAEATATALKQNLGPAFRIQTRFQQNEVLYKVLRTEKWAVFAILSFILIIASFNIIGALSMLVLEKKKDMAALTALGLNKRSVVKLFLLEGWLLSFFGGLIGIVLAIILCLLQQHVGLVPMPGSTFIVHYYPVEMRLYDFLAVAGIVTLISLITAYLPAKKAAANIEKEYLSYLS